MGIYIFKTDVLMDLLSQDDKPDFGKDILPDILKTHKVMAYPYRRENKISDVIFYTDEKGERREKVVDSLRDSEYWRDVGNLDAYWNANMDLTGVDPYFNMYGVRWPIRTYQRQYPPVKTVFAQESEGRASRPRPGFPGGSRLYYQWRPGPQQRSVLQRFCSLMGQCRRIRHHGKCGHRPAGPGEKGHYCGGSAHSHGNEDRI
jgi:hypothetical protein